MNWIKNKLFWRKYRWYRKDDMSIAFIHYRLTTKKAIRIIKHLSKRVTELEYQLNVANINRGTIKELVNE